MSILIRAAVRPSCSYVVSVDHSPSITLRRSLSVEVLLISSNTSGKVTCCKRSSSRNVSPGLESRKVSFAPFSAAQTKSHPIQRINQRKTGSLRKTYRKMATLLHSSSGTIPDRNDKNPQQLMTLNKEPTHHRIHSFRGQHKPSSGSLRHGIHTK